MVTKENSVRSADQFLVDARAVIGAIVRGDSDQLRGLSDKHRAHCTQIRSDTELPVDPWSHVAVRYGAQLALAEVAGTGAEMVLPAELFGALLRSSEARRVLLSIAGEPGGVVDQAKIPQLTGIHRSNAHNALGELERTALIERQYADPKQTLRRLALTPTGWSAVELLKIRGLAATAPDVPSFEQLVTAQVPMRRLQQEAEDLVLSLGTRESGRFFGTVLRERPSKRRHLCRVLARSLDNLDADRSREFLTALLDGVGGTAANRPSRGARRVSGPKPKSEEGGLIDKLGDLRWSACQPLLEAARMKLKAVDAS